MNGTKKGMESPLSLSTFSLVIEGRKEVEWRDKWIEWRRGGKEEMEECEGEEFLSLSIYPHPSLSFSPSLDDQTSFLSDEWKWIATKRWNNKIRVSILTDLAWNGNTMSLLLLSFSSTDWPPIIPLGKWSEQRSDTLKHHSHVLCLSIYSTIFERSNLFPHWSFLSD